MKFIFIFIILTSSQVLCHEPQKSTAESHRHIAKHHTIREYANLQYNISEVSRENIRNGLAALEAIEELTTEEQRISGYRLLFDDILSSGNLYSIQLMALAQSVFLSYQINPNNEDLKYIREHLPQSVLNFPWKNVFRIRNKKNSEYFFSPHNHTENFPNEFNRHVFSKVGENECSNNNVFCWFIIKKKEGSNAGVLLESPLYREFLYASDADMAHDKNRRSVYFWRAGNNFTQTGGDLWMFEPIQESEAFKIYNVHYEEYLVSPPQNNLKFSEHKRHVFTLRRPMCEGEQCEFFLDIVH